MNRDYNKQLYMILNDKSRRPVIMRCFPYGRQFKTSDHQKSISDKPVGGFYILAENDKVYKIACLILQIQAAPTAP